MILLQKDSEIGPVSNVFDKYVRSKEKVKNLDKEDQDESRIDLTNLVLETDRTLLRLVTKRNLYLECLKCFGLILKLSFARKDSIMILI